MSYSNRQPSRYTKTNNIGKTKDTGLLFTILVERGNYASAQYYADSSAFLPTSTPTFTQSAYDLSSRVVSGYEANAAYNQLAIKPYLDGLTRPFSMANAANAQVDTNFIANLIANDTVRVAFVSNYAGATVTVRLASDTGYTNTISWNITGSTVNSGTTLNPKYETIQILKVNQGVLSGTPTLSAILRSRILSVNSTTTNIVTPILLQNANNVDCLAGQVINDSLCCADNFIDKLITEVDKIKCGTSVIGQTITGQSIESEFSIMEETPRFLALFGGTNSTIDNMEAWKHLTGYEVGQVTNKITADVVSAPTLGQAQIGTGLFVRDVVIGCASLTQVPYFSGLETAVNSNLNGTGYYSYDTTSGNIYFNTANIGKTPEIKIGDNPLMELITPKAGQLPPLMKVIVQDIDSNNKRRITKILRMQFTWPDRSIETTGHKLTFKGIGYFSKTGDIQYGYEI